MNFDLAAFVQDYATLDDMVAWANGIMVNPPHFVIGDHYLERWYVLPRNERCNVYLHRICHSDDDRALHDHPWPNVSVILSGTYKEITPEGEFTRTAGDVVHRSAKDRHRLIVDGDKPVVTLFVTGPAERDWGFWCGPDGDTFVHWRDFTAPNDHGQVGAGCGEHGNPTRFAAPVRRGGVDYPAVAGSPLNLVMGEVARAIAKFPTWPTDPLHAVAVLGEEYGELVKAVLQATYEPHKSGMAEVRAEAIQAAAMALRFVASLDTYVLTPGDQHDQPEWVILHGAQTTGGAV